MNLTYICHKRIGNVENENNSPINIRFVSKTSDIRNVSQNIRSDVKTSEETALVSAPAANALLIKTH